MSGNTTEIRNVTRAGAPRIKTWRERIGATSDFPLHVPSEVERAMEAEIAELRGSWRAGGPLNGIPATFRHDEGAIARCSYCGRYTLDRNALSDRQPACECGKQHGWSGSFVKPGSDAKWSGTTPVARAASVEIVTRIEQEPDRVSTGSSLLDEAELAALRRFMETCEDCEGYDVPKGMMQRLAEIGVVRRTSGTYYQTTDFGMQVLDQPTPAPILNPFMPMSERQAHDLQQQYDGIALVRAVEQQVLARFAVLGNCRRCEARGTYAGLVDGKVASVPCADCGGTGKTAAYMEGREGLASERHPEHAGGSDEAMSNLDIVLAEAKTELGNG